MDSKRAPPFVKKVPSPTDKPLGMKGNGKVFILAERHVNVCFCERHMSSHASFD